MYYRVRFTPDVKKRVGEVVRGMDLHLKIGPLGSGKIGAKGDEVIVAVKAVLDVDDVNVGKMRIIEGSATVEEEFGEVRVTSYENYNGGTAILQTL